MKKMIIRFNRLFIVRLVGAALALILCSCSMPRVLNIDSSRDTRTIKLPSPVESCSVSIRWQDITPGSSTYDDIIRIMGEPDQVGVYDFQDGNAISYAGYSKSDRIFSKSLTSRVFFRPNHTVDWVELLISGSKGNDRYTLQNIVDELGSRPSMMFLNSSDDVLGPDEVFVWPACGLAVISIEQQNASADVSSTFQRYPVLMEIMFQPTTDEGFNDYYRMRIPYNAWDESLRFRENRPHSDSNK